MLIFMNAVGKITRQFHKLLDNLQFNLICWYHFNGIADYADSENIAESDFHCIYCKLHDKIAAIERKGLTKCERKKERKNLQFHQ